MNRAIAIAATLSMLSAPAASQQLTGSTFLELCEQQEIGLQNGCTGYAMGMMSALIFWNQIEPAQGGPTLKFCPPESGMDPQQIQDLFIQFTEDNPKYRNNAAGMSAFLALLEAYPCE